MLHGLACRLRRVHLVCRLTAHIVCQPVHKPASQIVFTDKHGGQKKLDFLVCLVSQVFRVFPVQTLSFLLRKNFPTVLSLLPERTHTQLAVRIVTTKAKA